MAIKDLLVAYDGNEASEKALEFALRMGAKYGAVVTGINVTTEESIDSHVRRWMSKDMIDGLKASRIEAVKGIEEKFKAHIKASGYTGETGWLVEEGQPDLTLARSARFYDVLIIGQFLTAFKSERRTVDPAELLLRAGKPVIVVPKDYAVRDFKEEAAVAWDGSRFAARALTDAMQILETKKKLDVLIASSDPKAAKIAAMPGLDILVHLNRHGIAATTVDLEGKGRGIGEAIVAHCKQTDPDVLVMGAYGRGTFGSLLFGGVTQHVLQNQPVPVLISH